jgi:hypothetical protein
MIENNKINNFVLITEKKTKILCVAIYNNEWIKG